MDTRSQLQAVVQAALDDPSALESATALDAANRLEELLTPANDEDDMQSRWLLGWMYWHRHQAAQATDDADGALLEAAVLMHAHCLAHGKGPLPEELLPALADEVAPDVRLWLERAMRTRDEDAVGVVPVLVQRVVDATPPDHDTWAARMADLGTAFYLRWESFGDEADLLVAEDALRAAVQATSPDDSGRVYYLSNLGNVLSTRCEHLEDDSVLDEAIATLREVLAAAAESHVQAAALSSLSRMYLVRAALAEGLTQTETHLAEAASVAERAISLLPAEDSERFQFLANFANVLMERFEVTSAVDDLDRAVALYREAAGLPDVDQRRAARLSNLGIALRTRFETTGSEADLDEAVENRLGSCEQHGGLTPRG